MNEKKIHRPNRYNDWQSWEVTRAIAIASPAQTIDQYRDWVRSTGVHLPIVPACVFKDEWKGWHDYLGTAPKVRPPYKRNPTYPLRIRTMELRKVAISAGKMKYVAATPCKKGHFERYVKANACCICASEYNANLWVNNKEHMNKRNLVYQAKHETELKAYRREYVKTRYHNDIEKGREYLKVFTRSKKLGLTSHQYRAMIKEGYVYVRIGRRGKGQLILPLKPKFVDSQDMV